VRENETRIAQVGVHDDPPPAGPAASGAAGQAAGAVEVVGRLVEPVTGALASSAGDTGAGVSRAVGSPLG
jgi:hypothetical protein